MFLIHQRVYGTHLTNANSVSDLNEGGNPGQNQLFILSTRSTYLEIKRLYKHKKIVF